MSHYVYRNLQATEISKLQLIRPMALYAFWNLAVHSDIIHFIFIATRSFYDKKRL